MAAKDDWTEEERQAMKDRAKEFRDARKKAAQDPLGDLMSKINEMPEHDKRIALRIHELVLATVPELQPKTWYGMPAWATPGKDGKIICFYQSAAKFKVRFSTFGFSEHANLDSGLMWPTSYALLDLSPEIEANIVSMVKQAAS
jgi:uncharacterized protein YdhG (YjbR/CyaY superfamily)